MRRKVKAEPRVFVCERCGGRWDQPTGIHIRNDSGRAAWCQSNAREVKPAPRRRRKGRR